MPFFDNLKTIREHAGINIATLAKKANIDRGTVTRIEKHYNSTTTTLHSIINALNNLNPSNQIQYEDVVTETSKFGENNQ